MNKANVFKRVLCVLIIAIFSAFMLISCDSSPEPTTDPCENGHVVVLDKGVAPTCTRGGISGGKHCARCHKVLEEQITLPPTDHTLVTSSPLEPTCTSEGYTAGSQCSVCFTVFSEKKVLDKLGHSLNDHRCTRCDYCEFEDPLLYRSTYGYDYLGTLPNGSNLQKCYNEIDRVAKEFHFDTTKNLILANSTDKEALLPQIDIIGCNLTIDELVTVLTFHEYDNPMYYWLGRSYYYYATRETIVGYVCLTCDANYINGSEREKYNSLLYEAVEEYFSIVENEDSAYLTVLAYHNMIANAIDYAFEADGVTPQDDRWAYNVIGVFSKKGAVCEGYAKALQLLLNFSGIENIYVSGYAGGRHAWNMIKLDDGKWYWCDTTWNDDPSAPDGITYDYFCVGDAEFTNHTPRTPDEDEVSERLYPLPDCAKSSFSSESILEIGEVFTVEGRRYKINGYKSAICTLANGPIPETVTYNGIEYSVK